MNMSLKHQLSDDRHTVAMDKFIAKTMDDTPEADRYAKSVNDKQWSIVAEGVYGMNDAFVLAVEAQS